jgi:hypothetical protein
LLHLVDVDTVQLSFDELSIGDATGILAGGDDVLLDPVFGLAPESTSGVPTLIDTAIPATFVRADEILTLLETLNRAMGKTIVMVTHDPAAAARASLTRHLDKGRLRHEGDVAEGGHA